MRICITGGAGYVGSALVPYLLNKGHIVTVLDTFWYGDYLQAHPNLTKIKGDIRKISDLRQAFRHQDAVIHLACVSNDPSFDMSPHLGKKINYECFTSIIGMLKEQRIDRFIYASSSSVYGVSELKDVVEDSPKNPLTDYSRYKLVCETMLHNYLAGCWTIVRPATVCGYAPRLRLDLVVNVLTISALEKREITLFGRDQKRPNININDMVRAYEFLLGAEQSKISGKVFNVGFENKSLYEIALLVQKTVPKPGVIIVEKPTNDPRSYHINSDKISALGFRPIFTIKDAIASIAQAHSLENIKDPLNNSAYYNIKRMKELNL